jgi:hypothetical protein
MPAVTDPNNYTIFNLKINKLKEQQLRIQPIIHVKHEISI